jgi:hypothetical protein
MSPAAEYAFVTVDPFVGDASAASSPNALTAARTLAPTYALNQLGYIARAFSLYGDAPIGEELRSAKAVVFNGCERRYRALAERVNARVFYDLAEVPAEDAFLGDGNAALTAASEYVAERTAALTRRVVPTVPEPLQSLRGAPRPPQAPRRSRFSQWLARRAGLDTESWRLGVLWSGDGAEAQALLAALPALAKLAESMPMRLHCVAAAGGALEQLTRQLPASLGEPLRPTLEAWSPQGWQQAVASCDLVLLPHAGPASRSRLIGALHAGRFCVARASPHLGSLAAHAWVGEDLIDGIRWSLSHPDQVLDRISAGQRFLDAVHAPDRVARTWIDLFHKRLI